jgi:hypothetical protein
MWPCLAAFIKWILGRFRGGGGGGQDAAAEAEKAGGEELGDLGSALVLGVIIDVPRHSQLPAAPSRCGLPRETYAVAGRAVRKNERVVTDCAAMPAPIRP